MDQRESYNDGHELFDWAQIRDYVGFFMHSISRHKKLVMFTAVLLGAAAFGALSVLPKTYHVETKVLAVRNNVLSIRGDMNGPEPSKAATETILRHDNLVALVNQTDMVHSWYLHRAPAKRLKDSISDALRGGPEPEADRMAWMSEMLEKQLTVFSTPEGAVVIQLDFPDPLLAFQLVEAAQQNFLEARHVAEIQAITESVSILQSHGASLRQDIDAAVDAIQKLRSERTSARRTTGGSTRVAREPASTAAVIQKASDPDAALTALKVAIEAKQRTLSDLEDFRRRRLTELQAKLAEQQAIFTPSHPAILDLQQTIASISSESPNVISLRKELAGLRAEYAQKAAAEAAATPTETATAAKPARSASAATGGLSLAAPQIPGEIVRMNEDPTGESDPAMLLARGRLRDAMANYAALRGQIQGAQIDLETAQAAFKYRYSVISPPQIPKKAVKPKVPVITAAAVVAGLILGMLLALRKDLRKGRIMEKWQVERMLGLQVLGEIELPKLPSHEP